jgi:hypothetical protein
MWSLFALADPFRGDGLGSASLRRRHYRTTAMPMNRPIAAWPRPSAIRVAALPETAAAIRHVHREEWAAEDRPSACSASRRSW